MNNVERGYLLAGLFPEELPGIIQDIHNRVAYLQEHKDDIRKTWDNGLITFDFWHDLAKRVLQPIEKYESKLLEKQRLFADQLSTGIMPCLPLTVSPSMPTRVTGVPASGWL